MRWIDKLIAYQKAIPQTPYREGFLIRLYYFWQEWFTSAGRALISVSLIALFLFMVPGAFLSRLFLAFLVALLLISFLVRRKPQLKITSVFILPVREKETGTLFATVHSFNEAPFVFLGSFRINPSLKSLTALPRPFKHGERDSIAVKIKSSRRGAYLFKRIAVIVPDALGLVQSRVYYEGVTEFLVYPRLLQVRQFPFLTQGPLGRDFALLLMPSLDRGIDFMGVRPYREGDSVRDVDHRAFARYLKPFTKEFAEERGAGIVFVLDVRFSQFTKKIFMEPAIALAGAIATWFDKRNVLGRFFINDEEIDITRGECLPLVLAALARIPEPRFKSKEVPGTWSPKARPMGPVFAVCLVKNNSSLIHKQIVVSDKRGGDDSVLFWEPSKKEEVFL